MSHVEDWQNIAASIRVGIEKRLVDMAAMNPGELVSFIDACQKAESLEMMTDFRTQREQDFVERLERPWKEK